MDLLTWPARLRLSFQPGETPPEGGERRGGGRCGVRRLLPGLKNEQNKKRNNESKIWFFLKKKKIRTKIHTNQKVSSLVLVRLLCPFYVLALSSFGLSLYLLPWCERSPLTMSNPPPPPPNRKKQKPPDHASDTRNRPSPPPRVGGRGASAERRAENQKRYM